MKTIHPHLLRPIQACLFAGVFVGGVHGQSPVPPSITYQGRVAVNGVAFTGMGSFKFALVKQTAPPPTATYESLWSNDGTSVNGSEPTAAVEGIAIQGGQYSVALGDTSLSGMSLALSATVLASHEGLKLRVWFNDGTNGFQQLSPDVVLGAVPYAQVAARVPDGTITGAMVARETLTGENLSDGSVTAMQLADGTITGAKIAGATITGAQLAAATIDAGKLTPEAADSLSSSLVQTAPVTGFTAMESITALDAVAVTVDGLNNPRIVKASSADGSRSAFYGFAKANAAAGEQVIVQQYGALSGFSGLVSGQSYFVGQTLGQIALTGGTMPVYAGHAISPSVLFVDAFGNTRTWGGFNYWGDGSDGPLVTTADESFPSVQDGEVIVKNFTHMTINAGHTVTTQTRCRGLVIYVNGDCVINGSLTMTARGASVNPVSIPETGIRLVRIKSDGPGQSLAASELGVNGPGGVGANWLAAESNQRGANGNGVIYSIAKVGGAGGGGNHSNEWWQSVSGSPGGIHPSGTGGGGGGNAAGGWSGSGSAGTCFSGGSGGGAVRTQSYATSGGNGSAYGGPGGGGSWTSPHDQAGGGAGNGGGGGNQPGQSGTGGLLVLMVRGNLTIGGTGQVTSRGSNGGSAYQPGGGSGGGRIIILHAGSYSAANQPSAAGGTGGGSGGAGAVTIDRVNK